MAQSGVQSDRSRSPGLTLQLLFAAVLLLGVSWAQTTAAPHPDPCSPEKGTYVVKDDNNTVCLMAAIGVQLNVSYVSVTQNQTVQTVVNIQPNATNGSGWCRADSASLMLTTDGGKTQLSFTFGLNMTSKKYHLSEVVLSANWTDMRQALLVQNSSLDYLRGSSGFSYMCRDEQTLFVADDLSLNVFQVQVQPFGLVGDQFGAAEECQLDEDDMLIPIIVGAALAVLVLVVLLAYLIGRKRSHAGYQTI